MDSRQEENKASPTNERELVSGKQYVQYVPGPHPEAWEPVTKPTYVENCMPSCMTNFTQSAGQGARIWSGQNVTTHRKSTLGWLRRDLVPRCARSEGPPLGRRLSCAICIGLPPCHLFTMREAMRSGASSRLHSELRSCEGHPRTRNVPGVHSIKKNESNQFHVSKGRIFGVVRCMWVV